MIERRKGEVSLHLKIRKLQPKILMKINRRIGVNGEIFDSIRLSQSDNAAIDRCHEILRKRFEKHGASYDEAQKNMCEWWLLGLLRYEGKQKMIDMAESAPFRSKRKLSVCGYAETKEVSL